MNRRTVLASATATIGIAGCLSFRDDESPCEIACFEFLHEGWDDAPDWLTITHTEGRNLPSEEVFITNVVVEHGRTTDWVIETVAWHEVDDKIGPSDGIAGESVRIDLASAVVTVLWRNESEERVLDKFRFD